MAWFSGGSQLSTTNSQLFITPLRQLDRLELQRLAVQFRRGHRAVTLVFPGEDVGKLFIVAQSFAVRRLMFLAEMAAARLVAGQRVGAHELGELQEIGDASGAFERLIE